MRALFVLLALVLGALAFRVDAASACSCVPLDPRAALVESDAAFVGTLVERRDEPTGDFSTADPVTLVFQVETAVKGELGETVLVRTAMASASCGVEAEIGQRIGLFLRRDGSVWTSSLCAQVDPEHLMAAARPLPRPDGSGPLALLVGGSFGDVRTIGLDARGRTLAYGRGGGATAALSVCPDSRRVVELVDRGGGSRVLAVRELRTFRVRSQRTLALGRDVFPAFLRCADSAGARAFVFATGPGADEARVVRVGSGGPRVLWRGRATAAALDDGAAYLAAVRRLLRVDYGTRQVRTIVQLPAGVSSLVVSPDGSAVGAYVDSVGQGIPPRVAVVETAGARLRSAALRVDDYGELRWVGNERLGFFPAAESSPVRVFDRSLRVRGSFTGWNARAVAAKGGNAYGVTWPGKLVVARLPDGPARELRLLPSPTANALVEVPGRVTVKPVAARVVDYTPLASRDESESSISAARVVTWILGITAFGLAFWRFRQRSRSRRAQGTVPFGDSPR